MTIHCPCSETHTYTDCCERYHKRETPQNAKQLMRSRYSAYALDLPEYIIATTHPGSPLYEEDIAAWKQELSLFSQTTNFKKLLIHDFQEKGEIATVTFTAVISTSHEKGTFTEKSVFQKKEGQWLYCYGKQTKGRQPKFLSTESVEVLPLAYYDEPVLRKSAAPVDKITDEIRALISQMTATMDTANGLGIAAPQVHHSLRIFVTRVPDDQRGGKVEVYINPEISSPSTASWLHDEGCLSIPTIRGDVRRPKEITIEYTNLEGQRIKKRVSGWEARVLQHENDHLNGILFFDHLSEKEQQLLAIPLQNLKKRLH